MALSINAAATTTGITAVESARQPLFFPLSGIFFYHISLSGRAIITVEERKLRRGYFEES